MTPDDLARQLARDWGVASKLTRKPRTVLRPRPEDRQPTWRPYSLDGSLRRWMRPSTASPLRQPTP